MTARNVTIEELRRFSPLDGLKRENIAALAKKTQVRQLESGQQLFKVGDSEKRTFYLLAGVVELTDSKGNHYKGSVLVGGLSGSTAIYCMGLQCRPEAAPAPSPSFP